MHFPPEAANLPQHNTGSLGANNYPPAYYVAALPFFELPWLSRATDRDYSIRLLSALLGALVVVLTYRLARTAGLGNRLALVAAALATSAPIMTQQSAVFSPDILLVVTITGLADAMLRVRRRLDRRTVIPVLAWGLLAALTKPVGLPAAAAVALTIAILTLGDLRTRTRVGLLAGTSAIGLLIGGLFASTLFGIAVPGSFSLTAAAALRCASTCGSTTSRGSRACTWSCRPQRRRLRRRPGCGARRASASSAG